MYSTPKILIPALRQYQHNKPDGEVFAGFDYAITCNIVIKLLKTIKDLKNASEKDTSKKEETSK